VVLNREATGNAGPSVLFETSPRDAELVRVLAASAPSPVGNFALVDGTAYYHSSQDTLAALDLRSVQHTGETMLALTRALRNRDPPRLSATDDATFFPLLGRLVTYPQALAGLAVLAVTACAVAARRLQRTTVARLLTSRGPSPALGCRRGVHVLVVRDAGRPGRLSAAGARPGPSWPGRR
jgi:hypothetical protein